MGAIGDEQPPARSIGQYLAWKIQRTVTALRGTRQFEGDWLLVQCFLFPMNGDELFHGSVDPLVEPLAGAAGDDVTLRIDQDQGRPGFDHVAPPDAHVGVIHHGVRDLVAENGLADALGVLLVLELGRVHADND